MTDAPDKIQWHPAFYAAAELELKEDIRELELIQEYPLSKEPIRIDLLVIRAAGAERAWHKGKVSRDLLCGWKPSISGTDRCDQQIRPADAQQFKDTLIQCQTRRYQNLFRADRTVKRQKGPEQCGRRTAGECKRKL